MADATLPVCAGCLLACRVRIAAGAVVGYFNLTLAASVVDGGFSGDVNVTVAAGDACGDGALVQLVQQCSDASACAFPAQAAYATDGYPDVAITAAVGQTGQSVSE